MKLPSVYANKIDKDIRNNEMMYRGDKEKKKDLRELKSKFDSRGYVNRLSVKLKLKDGREYFDKLILAKDDYFININNEKVYYDDIIDYDIQ